MSKHTPGPWKAIQSGQIGRAAAAFYIAGTVKDHRCRMVAHVKNSPKLPTEANARLIAAAPALLEALEAICEALEDDDSFSAIQIARNFARAAIAAAKGEQ